MNPDEHRLTAIVDWLLEHAATCDTSGYRANSSLRVVAKCECGCASAEFEARSSTPGVILADAVAVYPDGQKAGVILWGCDGEITELEVYELDEVADRLPEIAYLRRWEGLKSVS